MQYMATNAVEWLPGRWHVLATNFPMWLKGDKLRPTFTYTVMEDGRLLDEVQYHRKDDDAVETITGYDQFDHEIGEFVWRGKGLLFIARSQWRVLDVRSDGEAAIIEFNKTLFTAAGMDVISRSPDDVAGVNQYTAEVFVNSELQPNPPLKWLTQL